MVISIDNCRGSTGWTNDTKYRYRTLYRSHGEGTGASFFLSGFCWRGGTALVSRGVSSRCYQRMGWDEVAMIV